MQVNCSHCGQILEYSSRPPRFCSNCGQPLLPLEATQPFDPPTVLAPSAISSPSATPESVGGYHLLRPLGSGGMGTVYEGEDQTTGRRVAVKLIRPEFADSPETVERFRREGRLAGTVVHPRCVFVLAADEEAGRPYIVMELMPGDNLGDLVEKSGPLPPAEAVARILDVIEGLQEMHRCGLIHRDVKPSNCFLDADGRVKVGDFGLSKSLVKDTSLTQSGAFLGTLLFAAPEQIRNDKVDHQADLYSVAATLYYLLTGRPPFEAEDAAATLAKIVSDPLTSMRHWRPELPATLDEIVLRGLARSRERRWQSLEEFRLALLPFVPGSHSLGELGWRSVAYVCDVLLLAPLQFGLLKLLHGSPPMRVLREYLTGLVPQDLVQTELLLSFVVSLMCGFFYFALPEWFWGCSPGKYLFRLRVRTVRRNDRPDLPRSLLRTLTFYLFKDTGPLLVGLLVAMGGLIPESGLPVGALLVGILLAIPLLEVLSYVLGLVLLASTMRRRNGYRGIHDFLSGTRVIRLPALLPRRLLLGYSSSTEGVVGPSVSGLAYGSWHSARLPERLGAFSIHGAFRWTAEEKILLGEDTVLGRKVWIWLRPQSAPVLAQKRREVGRTTRPRWLASGRQGEWQWDAFVASAGCPLPELVQRRQRLYWPEVQYLLEQLAEELVAACADGTLPGSLRLGQIWVQSSGRLQLLDTPLREEDLAPTSGETDSQSQFRKSASRERQRPEQGQFAPVADAPGSPKTPVADAPGSPTFAPECQTRALGLLRGMVRLTLEGRLPGSGEENLPLRAPLPGYAGRLLARLVGARLPYATVDEFNAALETVRERPAEVTRPRRRFHLTLQGLALAPGLIWMLALVSLVTYFAFSDRFYSGLRGEVAQEELVQVLPLDVACLAGQPEAWSRLLAGGRMSTDWAAEEQLRPRLERVRKERQVVLESASWFTHKTHDKLLANLKQAVAGPDRESFDVATDIPPWPSAAARRIIGLLDEPQELTLTPPEDYVTLALLAGWPLLWAGWAFVFRGGLSFRVAGISLMQEDGRRAARWRCAWRALLVWLPFLLLLAASLALELFRLASLATEPEPAGSLWLAWLAWLAWWLAVGLLPLYFWLAQRWPARGWHDRLAGTYLVPR